MTDSIRFALRRLARRPSTSALHVGGLAVGLACCFLALLFVQDELGYDRFHEGAERIVGLRQELSFGDQTMDIQSVPKDGRAALDYDVPGVEAVTETNGQGGLVRRAPEAEGVVVEDARFADASFFDVFTFPLVRGDAATALDGPGRAVLTASLARSLFGSDDPVGQDVYLERTGFGLQDPDPILLTVTGVAADPPAASSILFDLLVSGQTEVTVFSGMAPALDGTGATYVRLAALRDTAAVKAALNALAPADDSFAEFVQAGAVSTPRLIDQHLSEGGTRTALVGRPLYLALFSTVAALVLLLACVNYANLATALALGRATEVGVRKTLGAGRGQLARLFLIEAVALALAAGGVAVALVALVLPAFNAFFEKGVSLSSLGLAEWAVVPALAVAAGLLAGAYPALVLARFRPATALRGGGMRGRGGTTVRRALVVFQFAVTIVLLASTAVVAQQLDAARSRDLGFEGDRVVSLGLQADRLRQQAGVLKEEVASIPGVARVALGSGVPGAFSLQTAVSASPAAGGAADDVVVTFLQADADYAAALGLKMAAGAWFDADAARSEGVVLNEAAARQLGLMTTDPTEAMGKGVGIGAGESRLPVIGVLRDFHFQGPRAEIGPVVVQPVAEFATTLELVVQLNSADARTLGGIQGVWERVVPEYPFDPQFVTDTFAGELREDRRLGQLFGALGGVAVVLACLGVFGLAAHAADRRRKEVGIRKVLGATVAGLVARLSGEFAALVAVALVVAGPVVWWTGRRWLEDFAYPAPLAAWPFVAVALGVLALALLAAGVHAIRAATADPVRALRSE
ncbi:ABC transporter permease [Rubrivirga litoralis]|uniref:ABC transporter permease n=1 Tax=Rubrivirga litoralis TaxID=3075598 RepID=A0ABU3BTQ8_9BACT|nr:ABC transporter permease [Rubrivirga sp. F394]MDT0632556.1 ABC transporter permease [Rubrivirga sp. F394]